MIPKLITSFARNFSTLPPLIFQYIPSAKLYQ